MTEDVIAEVAHVLTLVQIPGRPIHDGTPLLRSLDWRGWRFGIIAVITTHTNREETRAWASTSQLGMFIHASRCSLEDWCRACVDYAYQFAARAPFDLIPAEIHGIRDLRAYLTALDAYATTQNHLGLASG